MKKNVFGFVAIALLFAALGVFIGYRQTSPDNAAPTAVDSLLSQSMNDVQGQAQALSQWKNVPLVVNFWATWCPPCVEEMPELSALQKELAASKIQIIGIGIDSPSNIAEFAKKHQIEYPLYVGGMTATELSRQFGNQAGGLPYTVLIGKDGQVKKTYIGRLKMDELRSDVNKLL